MDVQSMYTTRAFTCAIADKQPILDLLVACDRPKSVVESLSNYNTPNPPFTLYQAHLMSGCFLGEPGNLLTILAWTTASDASWRASSFCSSNKRLSCFRSESAWPRS